MMPELLKDLHRVFFILIDLCLTTSAGVRIRQETISPVEEAIPLMIGCGIADLSSLRFTDSYVAKKDPADQCHPLLYDAII